MNKIKEAFTRTCIACNKKDNKYNLLRISYTKNKDMCIDKENNNIGRGIYLCYDLNCLQKLEKTNKLEKKLKKNISEKIYEDIRGVIIERKQAENKEGKRKNGGEV